MDINMRAMHYELLKQIRFQIIGASGAHHHLIGGHRLSAYLLPHIYDPKGLFTLISNDLTSFKGSDFEI
uniref:Uncharacterized protein n=1 Tax=Romanomermis culicivorax TaxID=13658 RepID=A0A915HQD8_ROMCU